MEKKAMSVETQGVLSYMERNGAWIKAAVCCLIIASAPMMMPIFDPAFTEQASSIGWLSGVGLLMGSFCIAYGLVKAETASARVVLFLLEALVIAAAVEVFLKWLGSLQ